MKFKFLILLTAFSFLLSFPVNASENSNDNEAYKTFSEARDKTHAAGPFRFRGKETSVKENAVNGSVTSVTSEYTLGGYDYRASETYMLLAPLKGMSEEFLITPEGVYTKSGLASTDWKAQDFLVLLPKFAALGTLDQFFMLEILNGDRLNLYADFMKAAPDVTENGATLKVIEIKMGREEFSNLAEVLTGDIMSLFGAAAESMTEAQLKMMQTFAKGMLQSLDAEIDFKIFIGADGKIARIDYDANMANPYGEAGQVSRIKTNSNIEFYDFGKEIARIEP